MICAKMGKVCEKSRWMCMCMTREDWLNKRTPCQGRETKKKKRQRNVNERVGKEEMDAERSGCEGESSQDEEIRDGPAV